MEKTRRSLFSLATVGCLLAGGLLLLPPGDGQSQSSAPPSSVSHFRVPLPEAGSQSLRKTASAVTVTDSQLNASGSNSLELPAPTTAGFFNITTGLQTITSRSVVNLTTKSAEGNQSSYPDPTATSWTSISNLMPTESFKSMETQGTTATPRPKSSTFGTLAVTKMTFETLPATEQEAIRENSTDESTSFPNLTATDRSVSTLVEATITQLTSEAPSSTFRFHRTTPVETKRLTDDVQEKTSGLHLEDNDLPSIPTDRPIGEDPLVIAVIFIFIVTVGILALMGFLRYRQRTSWLHFRRLQDLPMDDMMEDTPLSLYSY
ncbi:uncharacterized protein LOC125432310 isoform X2 [Sphaerodactylus townsendi]|nr:uncharacterized protein LOC125432310 isoform X2 [Sphaerodactylus townsendi]